MPASYATMSVTVSAGIKTQRPVAAHWLNVGSIWWSVGSKQPFVGSVLVQFKENKYI
ncbi:TPA: hypothetical protein MDE87_001783 [Klebsiella pneumoniae]|uniref:hypothetical protein n=1 Tax=Klebsiella quasipneumoniae TaxID=1463165 RepID=UPI0015A73C8B|nr:hypothetical protein [Klebsiella quasipneumoniae]EKZ9998765.1 hypothetical protein [Klebsiella pneumoniae]HBU8750159.1 hypothetical protein [Klebsiella pneumoniae]HBW4998635.1 hypothetical protein [Klebsiella pneumoniae]HBW5335210.1 hypothetical protein [Klebsiella pneumoniae]HBW5633234.1 hypothetical protein [Klebsiella pneumoniae]